MRYYNENPQVKHWMGKCAILQQELDIQTEIAAQKRKLGNHFLSKYKNLKDETEVFNSLPWYKKMFYKFNV